MTKEEIIVLGFGTIISLALICFNYIVLLSLKEKDGFGEYVPILIKIIILLPPLGIIYYFIFELVDFFDDYFKK